MPAQWTGNLIGQMHQHGITKSELALEAGVTREYTSMILNGHRSPQGAEEKLTAALNRIIERKGM